MPVYCNYNSKGFSLIFINWGGDFFLSGSTNSRTAILIPGLPEFAARGRGKSLQRKPQQYRPEPSSQTVSFLHCVVPVGKFRPPYLAKAAAREALPSPTIACWVFSCFRNPPNSDYMDYRISKGAGSPRFLPKIVFWFLHT